MKRFYYLVIRGNRSAYLAGVILLAIRAMQFFVLGSDDPLVELTFSDAYRLNNGSNIAAFVWIPLLATSTIRPAANISSSYFAVGAASRSRATIRCFSFALILGLVFSLMVNASTIPGITFAAGASINWQLLFLSTALQALVCLSAILVYFILLLAFEKGGLAFLGSVLYGLWDFMAQNVVGGGIPSIGWGLTIVPPFFGPSELAFRFLLLCAIGSALSIVMFVIIERKDYLPEKACPD